MIDARTIDPAKLRYTLRLTCQEALARGWEVSLYYPDSPHALLRRPDGKTVEIHGSIPPTTSFVASKRSDDKYLTYLHLKEQGIPMPFTRLAHDFDEIRKAFVEVRQASKKAVIKPLSASHGNGVHIGIENGTSLRMAYADASGFSDQVLLQEYVPHQIDIRIVCIDYRYQAALRRIPARVRGDGVSTIGELIECENVSGKRGVNYTADLGVIPVDVAKAYLGDGWARILPQGQWAQVVGAANVGMGGETADITDDLPDWLRKLAQAVAISLELPVCGVDILTRQLPEQTATQEDLQPVFIEANKSPALFIHDKPNHGRSRPVIAAFVDYLSRI